MAVDDSYTKALLHFNGDNDSTSITDESSIQVYVNGDAKLKTATKQLGTASCYFDGNGDYLYSTSNDLILGNLFTVDFWIYPLNFNADQALYDSLPLGGQGTRTNDFVLILSATSGKLKIFSNGGYIGLSDVGLNLNEWNHVAIVKSSDVIKYYINGTYSSFVYFNSAAGNYYVIGRYSDGGSGYFNGYIDELRVSVGVARWTTNFDVPTAEYGVAPEPTITAYLGSTAISKIYLGSTEISTISLG